MSEWGPRTPVVSYGGPECGATFLRACPVCGRFVKAAEEVRINGLDQVHPTDTNAECPTHGPVRMAFLGYH